MGRGVEAMAQALLDAVMDCGAKGLLEYFGDIDPKGFEILRNLTAVCGDFGLEVVPLYSGYDWLLRHGTPNLGQGKGVNRSLLLETVPLLTDKIDVLWQAGQRIPQEALGFEDLLEGGIEV